MNRIIRHRRPQDGFTLLELLVVVGILAIISGAVISAISGQEETAGQGVALNTMGALENATRQHVVINNGLPSDLDSLVCADLAAATVLGTDTLGTGTAPALLGTASTAVGDAFVGGLAPGLVNTTDGKLVLATLPAAGVTALTDAGVTNLRYVEATACDSTAGNSTTIQGVAVANPDAAVEGVLANTLFWDTARGGFGVALPLAGTAPVALLADPTDVGAEVTDVVAVFGVGNFNGLTDNNIISRGPVDGNVDGDGQYYSHFSLAIKVGEADDGAGLTNYAVDGDDIQIVAVLDSDGDHFDDEVAEFFGLEDE